MSIRREDMEKTLKTKIDDLLRRIEIGKARETELKREIQKTFENTKQEENLLPGLHDKLLNLEKTLEKKEKENDELKKELVNKELQANSTEEHWKREEYSVDDESDKAKIVREKYGSVLIDTQKLKAENEDLVCEISDVESQLEDEEEACNAEETRVVGLQKELDSLNQRLNIMEVRQDDLKQRESEHINKLERIKKGYLETELKANELEHEVGRLERILEELTEHLSAIKIEQDKLTLNFEKQRQRYHMEKKDSDVHLEKTTLHKAQRITSLK